MEDWSGLLSALGSGGGQPWMHALSQMISAAPMHAEPADMTGQYNTHLSPADEARYQQWVAGLSQQQNRDVSRDLYNYDLRGAWQTNAQQAANGHLPDDFKKPNHPTFSQQSQYNGVNGNAGGSWSGGNGQPWAFTPSQTNMANMGIAGLQDYWSRAEPGNNLMAPRGSAFPSYKPNYAQTMGYDMAHNLALFAALSGGAR